ncbi:MAG: hypothetical protein KAS39_01345, partial [Actinomycetia bacterium]|nr:hypothetical protein [Actinomycetes bacterium]
MKEKPQDTGNHVYKKIFTLLKFIVSAVLLGVLIFWIFIEIKEDPDVLKRFSNINYIFVLISFLMLGVSYVIATFQWF